MLEEQVDVHVVELAVRVRQHLERRLQVPGPHGHRAAPKGCTGSQCGKELLEEVVDIKVGDIREGCFIERLIHFLTRENIYWYMLLIVFMKQTLTAIQFKIRQITLAIYLYVAHIN